MMKPVQIICDPMSDLTQELSQKYRIECLPMQESAHGDAAAQDRVHQYAERFAQTMERGFQVVHLSLSGALSTRYREARCAAAHMKDVFVVDSESISAGLGHLAILAAELANAGLDGQEIARALESMKHRLDTSFLFFSAKNVGRGGLSTVAAMLWAKLRRLDLEIRFEHGRVRIGHKYKGSQEASIAQYVKERLEGNTNIQHDRIFISYYGISQEEIHKVEAQIKTLQPMEEIIEMPFDVLLCQHTRRGGIGIHFLRNT